MSSDWPTPPPIPSSFAHLVPANDFANTAFNTIASKIKGPNSQDWSHHAVKYMFMDLNERGPLITPHASENHGVGPEVTPSKIWRGFYQLDFNVPPKEPHRSWSIGGNSPSSDSDDDSVDFVLLEREKPGAVTLRVAHLVHNYSSGTLMIRASKDCTVILDGIEEVRADERLIYKKRTSVEIGRLKYILELEHVGERNHRSLLNEYKKTHSIRDADYPLSLMTTPSEDDQVIKHYILKNVVGDGATGVVYGGLDRRTGKAVAIKRFRRNEYNKSIVDRDRRMNDMIGRHPYLCNLERILAPLANEFDRSYKALGMDEVFFIYSPLADWTVEKLIGYDRYVDPKTCIEILRQFLDGVEYLHSKGIMHRDIKPANLAVVSLNPLTAQLLDFGHAIDKLHSDDERIGTPGYRAPEVSALLNRDQRQEQYDETIDLFSLGISMYRLLRQLRQRWWGYFVTFCDISRMGSELSALNMPGNAASLIISCIQWDPKMRPKAAEAKLKLKAILDEGDDEYDVRAQELSDAWNQAIEPPGTGRTGNRGRETRGGRRGGNRSGRRPGNNGGRGGGGRRGRGL